MTDLNFFRRREKKLQLKCDRIKCDFTGNNSKKRMKEEERKDKERRNIVYYLDTEL